MMGVLELWRYLLLPQGLYVLLFGTVGHLGEHLVVQFGRVPSGVAQAALELSSARVGGVAQEAVRARDVLADLGRLLGCHAAAGDEEDKPEDHHQEEDGADEGEPGRERLLAALFRRAAGTTRRPRTAKVGGDPVRSTLYTNPQRTCRGRGGTRTPTASRPLDPEPSASTNSATRPQALSGKRRKLRGLYQHFSTPPCGRLLSTLPTAACQHVASLRSAALSISAKSSLSLPTSVEPTAVSSSSTCAAQRDRRGRS